MNIQLDVKASSRKFIATARSLVGGTLHKAELEDVSLETTALLRALERTVALENDAPAVNELIHQTKLDIYNLWMNKLSSIAKSSHPELSTSLELLGEMHDLLFRSSDSEEARISRELFRLSYDVTAPSAQAALQHETPQLSRTQKVGQFFRADLKRWIPALKWLPNYPSIGQEAVDLSTTRAKLAATWSNFRSDLISGVTCGVVSVPQGLAYALLAGLPAILGLYTAFITPILYVIFGTSRHVSIGPVAVAALLVRTVLETLDESVSRVEGATALTVIVGLVMIALGMLRLGYVSNFLSEPVLHGFTAAAALIIAFSQLKDFFGLVFPYQEYLIGTLYELGKGVPHIHGITVGFAMCCLVFLILMKLFLPRLPKELIVVAVAIGVSYGANLVDLGVRIIGEIPSGLPHLTLPRADLMFQLLPQTVLLSVIVYAEEISLAKLYARKFGYREDADQELVALGAVNLFVAFFQGHPSGAAIGRTAVNVAAGVRTQLAGIFSGLVSMLTLLLLTGLFRYLPYSALAAIVIVAVMPLVDITVPKHLWHVNKQDCIMYFIALLGTLFGGVDIGIILAVAVSAIAIVLKASRPHTAVLGRVPNTVVYRDMKRTERAVRTPGIVVFRFDSLIFFANANYLEEELSRMATMALKEGNPSAIVFDCSAVSDIDASGVVTLKEILMSFIQRRILFVIASCSNQVRDILARGEIEQLLGEDHFFHSVHDAVRAVQDGSVVIRELPPMPPVRTCAGRVAGLIRRHVCKDRNTVQLNEELGASTTDIPMTEIVVSNEDIHSEDIPTEVKE